MNDLPNVESALALAGGKKIHWGRWLFAFSGLVIFLLGIFLLRSEFAVSGEGVVMARGEWEIQSPHDGWVTSIHAAEGAPVSKGQILWQLEEADLRERLLEVREQKEELRQAKAALQFSLNRVGDSPEFLEFHIAGTNLEVVEQIIAERKNLLERYAELAARQAISTLQIRQEELALLRDQMEREELTFFHQLAEGGYLSRERENYRQQIDGIGQQLHLLSQKKELFNEQMSARSIRSPSDGFLTNVQIRNPHQAVQRGQVFAYVIDPGSQLLVRAYVGERNIDLIEPGTPVRMSSRVFDSPLEGYVYGAVQRVGREAHRAETAARGERVFEIDIEVDETPFPLVYGSTLEVEIILGSRTLWQVMTGQRTDTRNAQ